MVWEILINTQGTHFKFYSLEKEYGLFTGRVYYGRIGASNPRFIGYTPDDAILKYREKINEGYQTYKVNADYYVPSVSEVRNFLRGEEVETLTPRPTPRHRQTTRQIRSGDRNIVFGFGIEHEVYFYKRKENADYDYYGYYETSGGTKYDIERTRDPTVLNSLELVSKKFRDKPYNTIKNLIKREKEVAYKTSPFGVVLSGGLDKEGGSYHLTLTMPYDVGELSTIEGFNKYNSRVIQGIRNIRWLQPLMMGILGSSTKLVVGNSGFPEGSYRQYADGYANIGMVNINNDGILEKNGREKRFEEIFGSLFRTSNTGGHGDYWGKYGNKHKDFGMFKDLDSVNFRPNTNRNVGDFTIKGYEEPTSIGLNPKSVEFRFTDNFHVFGLLDYVRFLVYVMQNGFRTNMIKDASSNRDWQNALKSIMEEGWNSQISQIYVKELADKLKLNINLPQGRTIRCDLAFELINDAIYKENKNGFWVKHYLKENKKPQVHNFNRSAWEYFFRDELVTNRIFYDKNVKFLTILSKVDDGSNKWINVNVKDSKNVIRDVITKEMGINYSAEDYYDILFFYETEKIIELKTLPNGEIEKIKVIKKFKNIEEIEKFLDKLKKNEKIFHDTDGLKDLTLEEPEELEPSPEPRMVEPTPEPRRTQREVRPQVTPREEPIVDNITTNVGNLRFRLLTPTQQISDMKSLLEDIFLESSFVDNQGNNLSWEIILVEQIRNGSIEVFSGWERNNNNIKLYTKIIDGYDNNDLDEQEFLKRWVKSIINGMSSDTNPTNLTQIQFKQKLIRTITSMFSKRRRINRNNLNNIQEIELSSAGIKTLESKGVRLVSVPSRNGYRDYFLVNKNNINKIREMFGKNYRFINSIPYYKDYKAELRGNLLLFYKNNKIKQRLII